MKGITNPKITVQYAVLSHPFLIENVLEYLAVHDDIFYWTWIWIIDYAELDLC